jgi:4-hydroxybenzoate polyprenyltransferase
MVSVDIGEMINVIVIIFIKGVNKMDILSLIFCISGWIFHIKGLVITALVFSIIIIAYQILKLVICKTDKKGKIACNIEFIINFAIIGLCIVFLVI